MCYLTHPGHGECHTPVHTKGVSGFDVLKLAQRVPDEASAYRYLEELRWGDTPVCGHCGSERVYFLTPKNGTSRNTQTGAETQRRL